MSNYKPENPDDVELFQSSVDNCLKSICYLSESMKVLTYKTSKLRDCGDELVRALLNLSDCETPPIDHEQKLFNQNLNQYAKCLSIIEDHRDSQIERLNSKVLDTFNNLEESLKFAKTELKQTSCYFNKEFSKQKKLNAKKLNEVTSLELKSFQNEINNLMFKFDSDKMKSIKTILKEFTLIQLSFCTQSIQCYTNAYKCLFNNQNNSFIIDQNLDSMSKELYKQNINLPLNLNKKLNEHQEEIESSEIDESNSETYSENKKSLLYNETQI